MGRGKRLEPVGALRREDEAHDAVVVGVRPPAWVAFPFTPCSGWRAGCWPSASPAGVAVLPATGTVDEAIRRFQDEGHGAYPVVDADGTCVGMLRRDALLGRATPIGMTVVEMADTEVVAVSPGDTVLRALHRMMEEEASHLPVVDGDRLVGICTRADVLKARRPLLGADRSEPGWRPVWRGQTRAT